jgi:hypothetical protein
MDDNPVKTAYSYVRWSTVSQGETGRDSQTRQITSAKKWIQEHGKGEYVLSDEVFIDAGKSASKAKHIEIDEHGRAKGELRRFIQLVEAGKIKRGSILLIDDFSRFSRLNPFRAFQLFNTVVDAGIGLVFTGSYEKRVIDEDLLSHPETAHVLQFIIGEMIRSHAEAAERGRKIKLAKQSLYANIKNGVVQRNNLPKYFTFVPNPGSKNIGRYIHNDKTSLVKEIAGMFLRGKSLYAIADCFNAKGIKTFKGYQWSGNGVREGIRVMLPSLIGKITVDTVEGRFYVYNRMGKVIFKSFQYESKRNNSAKWDESLKHYTKRRLKSGKVIILKRKKHADETVRD